MVFLETTVFFSGCFQLVDLWEAPEVGIPRRLQVKGGGKSRTKVGPLGVKPPWKRPYRSFFDEVNWGYKLLL